MKKLNAFKDGKGNIVITEGSFEYLLNCLDNQKYINSASQNQQVIDDFNYQCRDILHQKYIFDTDYDGYYLYKKYIYQEEKTEWSGQDLVIVNKLFKDKNRKIKYTFIDTGEEFEEDAPWLFERPMKFDGLYLTISEDGKNNRPWKKEEIEKICDAFNAYKYEDNEKNITKSWKKNLDKINPEFIDIYLRNIKIEKIKNKLK